MLYENGLALSAEAPALEATAALLAGTAGFLAWSGAADQAAAADHVIVGPWDAARDQTDAQIEARLLAELGGFAQLFPAADEAHLVIEGEAAASCPTEGGTFEINLRRAVSPEEKNDGGLRDVYLFALDALSAMETRLIALSWETGTVHLKNLRRVEGPVFVAVGDIEGQGDAVYATLLVEWGHLDNG